MPNCSKAVLAPEKLRDYLLSPLHPIGRYKALFFRTLGYDQTSWQQLAAAGGRPAIFGIAAGGAVGVDRIWHEIRDYWAADGPE